MMVFGISIAAWGAIHHNDPLTPVTPKWGGPSLPYMARSWPLVALIAGVGLVYGGYTVFIGARRR
jgi:hypothetical protein